MKAALILNVLTRFTADEDLVQLIFTTLTCGPGYRRRPGLGPRDTVFSLVCCIVIAPLSSLLVIWWLQITQRLTNHFFNGAKRLFTQSLKVLCMRFFFMSFSFQLVFQPITLLQQQTTQTLHWKEKKTPMTFILLLHLGSIFYYIALWRQSVKTTSSGFCWVLKYLFPTFSSFFLGWIFFLRFWERREEEPKRGTEPETLKSETSATKIGPSRWDLKIKPMNGWMNEWC